MGFQMEGLDDLIKELDALGEIDIYAPEMLKAATPILERNLKAEVEVAADKGYATGALAGSIKAGKPSQNHLGHYVAVTAQGKDEKGIRNNEKLAYLNYGTSKQAARPIISPAVAKSEEDCVEAMQKVFDEVTNR